MNKDVTHVGQAIFSKAVLSIYDLWVLGFSNRFAWKCKTQLIGQHFANLVSQNHLDMGVVTGYYLKKFLPENMERIALVDSNSNSLDFAKKAIEDLDPEIYQQDVLEPFNAKMKKFDSVSLNYLLHCLPGDLSSKSVVFKNISEVLNPNAVVFGSTILGKGVEVNALAKLLRDKYNNMKIFSNLEDDLPSLEAALNTHFSQVKIEIIGCIALFSAKAKS